MRRGTLYLLDTNTVGYIVSGRSPAARLRLAEQMEDASGNHGAVAISAISEAEMLYGLARRPEATRLRSAIEAFFDTVKVLAWDSEAARAYGSLRASLTAAGKSLANMDLLIAAHAVAMDAILVTSDKAFLQVEALRPVANWATDL